MIILSHLAPASNAKLQSKCFFKTNRLGSSALEPTFVDLILLEFIPEFQLFWIGLTPTFYHNSADLQS